MMKAILLIAMLLLAGPTVCATYNVQIFNETSAVCGSGSTLLGQFTFQTGQCYAFEGSASLANRTCTDYRSCATSATSVADFLECTFTQDGTMYSVDVDATPINSTALYLNIYSGTECQNVNKLDTDVIDFACEVEAKGFQDCVSELVTAAPLNQYKSELFEDTSSTTCDANGAEPFASMTFTTNTCYNFSGNPTFRDRSCADYKTCLNSASGPDDFLTCSFVQSGYDYSVMVPSTAINSSALFLHIFNGTSCTGDLLNTDVINFACEKESKNGSVCYTEKIVAAGADNPAAALATPLSFFF